MKTNKQNIISVTDTATAKNIKNYAMLANEYQ